MGVVVVILVVTVVETVEDGDEVKGHTKSTATKSSITNNVQKDLVVGDFAIFVKIRFLVLKTHSYTTLK